MNKVVKLVLNFSLIVVLIVGLIIGNVVLGTFENQINSLLSPAIVDSESLDISNENGQAMSKRIMEEGATLLCNENDTLPLSYSKDKKVNVFGWRSVDWIYGSEGQNASGGVSPEDNDFNKNVDIYKALNNYGISYNEALRSMYINYYQPVQLSRDLRSAHISTVTPLCEPKIDDKNYYSDSLLENAQAYSDVAIVVISRMAGEGMNCYTNQPKRGPTGVDDATRHYLEISTEEEALLKYVGSHFEKVIVLLNMANPFECGFLEEIEGLDACMYIGFTGTRAASAIPSLLYDNGVSPSGHTVDTFAYNLYTNPANYWTTLNYSDYTGIWYEDYIENIYVGYRWYETADAEGYWDTEEAKNTWGIKNGYEDVVQFPFGFGLSYNDYSWEVKDISVAPNSSITDQTIIDITVSVTNNGKMPGREVVAAYVTVPFDRTDSTPIEKSYVSLVGFNKTPIIEAGKSVDVVVSIDVDDFKSYDCYDNNDNGFKGYELEKGEYSVKLMTDSHNIKTVTYGGAEQPAEFKYKVDQTIKIATDKDSGNSVGNLFTGEEAIDRVPIDSKSKDGSYDPEIPWFTRTGFMSPDQWASKHVHRAVNPDAKTNGGAYTADMATAWDNATGEDAFGDPIPTTNPTWGANNGKMLAVNGVITDLGKKLGADYDAPEWEEVLDQLSISDIKTLVNQYYGTKAVASVGKPALGDLDGPSQIGGFVSGLKKRGTGYPTMVVIASTWNPSLAYEFGKSYGDDMKSTGYYGVWGWAIDNHRNAFFGRNHESPSEDPTLASVIVTNAVKGLNTRGRYCFIKHFALYGHGGNNKWMTEQALREIHLASFHDAFTVGGALGCMTTYQGIGAEHTETSAALLTGILRKEWGFKGAITTDYIGDNGWCDSLVRCGGDLGMGCTLKLVDYSESSTPRMQNRLREIGKHVLYMWLHADYNEQQYLLNPDKGDTYLSSTTIQSWVWWKPLVTCLNVVVIAACAVWAAFVLTGAFMPVATNNKGKEEVQ